MRVELGAARSSTQDVEVTHEFDMATHLIHDTTTGYHVGAIHPGWDINGNANGGYMMALAARAMRDDSGQPDPISVTAHYLAPGPAGDVMVRTEPVKKGRQLVTMTGSMHQGERELMRLLGSFGDVAAKSGGFQHTTLAAPELPPREQCIKHSSARAAVTVALADRLHIWFRPEQAPFLPGLKSNVAVIEGWAEFADGRPFDTLSMLLVADGFPPPVFHLDMPSGWVPTVELTVHVRGVPAPGPVRCRFHSEIVQNGFLQEDGLVWDSDGQLVAQSRQLALLPRG